MCNPYEEVKRKNIVIYGNGKLLRELYSRIDPNLNIIGITDKLCTRYEDNVYKGLSLIPYADISENVAFIISISDKEAIYEVSKKLTDDGKMYCHIKDAVEAYAETYKKIQIAKYDLTWENIPEPEEKKKIKKYITVHIPYDYCNFRCEYCYVRQVTEFKNKEIRIPRKDFLKRAFSRKRIGGTALFNFCAKGETMLLDEVVDAITTIVDCGHYASIVTNGTITRAFERLIQNKTNLKHCFFKFSFHYLELKKRNLFNAFWNNVKLVRKAGASITVELVASDIYLKYQDEIMKMCLKEVGALPHLSIPRDDRTSEIDLITDYEISDYKRKWEKFDSRLFDFKLSLMHEKRNEYCHAGENSIFVDISTGDLRQCVGHPQYSNAYLDLSKYIESCPVGNGCKLPYCYNGHVYLTLGNISDYMAPTYLEMRNRVCNDGTEWVFGEIKEIFSQKLYDSSF